MCPDATTRPISVCFFRNAFVLFFYRRCFRIFHAVPTENIKREILEKKKLEAELLWNIWEIIALSISLYLSML